MIGPTPAARTDTGPRASSLPPRRFDVLLVRPERRAVTDQSDASQDANAYVVLVADADDDGDRPQAVQLTERQTLVAIAECDIVLMLIATGLALRPDMSGAAISAREVCRLRRVARVLHRQLTPDGRAAVRARVTAPASPACTADAVARVPHPAL